ncbi:IucA/IucC family C-terminal-domain containing protein [Paenibacillaceae bacterium WGS1546]|uniref:IucA/IucC family C-terminal-domain containing protein n=1 Tax=Cohnella sp. WGS1546 TaxID=3366810 RepID=UPI00372D21CA
METWTRRVVEATVVPLIHMLYAHGIAMESHGQNLILLHRDGWPVRLALKDFHDGLRFSKAHLTRPEACPELHPEPPRHRALNRHSYMQTDDLEAVKDFLHSAFFFVFAAELCMFLNERYGLKEETFWESVAGVIHEYQDRYPQHRLNYERYDLFSDSIRIEQLMRRRLWKDAEVEPRAVPNPLRMYRRQGGRS